jgi:hypothetical protein
MRPPPQPAFVIAWPPSPGDPAPLGVIHVGEGAAPPPLRSQDGCSCCKRKQKGGAKRAAPSVAELELRMEPVAVFDVSAAAAAATSLMWQLRSLSRMAHDLFDHLGCAARDTVLCRATLSFR